MRTVFLVPLALAACAEEAIPDAATAPAVANALSPKKPEMLEAFSGMDPRLDPPGAAESEPELVVETVSEGSGDSIHYGMFGKFHFIGTLANGTVFRSTYGDDPKPVTFRMLSGVMPKGLALALEGCKVGERRRATIPSELAFGDQADYSMGSLIPAHSSLIYDIELVEITEDLRMKVLVEGDGDTLQSGQSGKFLYTGVLASDGSVFDSTESGEPRSFAVKSPGVIEGWAYGLPGMKVGEKRRLFVPSELAYGEQGRGAQITPNSDLIFDVELVEILP